MKIKTTFIFFAIICSVTIISACSRNSPEEIALAYTELLKNNTNIYITKIESLSSKDISSLCSDIAKLYQHYDSDISIDEAKRVYCKIAPVSHNSFIHQDTEYNFYLIKIDSMWKVMDFQALK